MIGVFTLAVLATLAAIGGLASRDRQRGREAAWRAIAVRRGGRLAQQATQLRLRVGEIEISVELRAAETRARALYPVAAGPRFVLHRRQAGVAFGDVPLEAQPIARTGLARLDASFDLRTAEPDASRQLFGARAAALLCEHFGDAMLLGERASLRLDVPRVVADAAALDAAIDLVAELAAAELFGLPALRELPAAREVPPHGVELEVGGALVHYAPLATDGGAGTRAWVEVDAGPIFELPLPCDDPPASLPRAAAAGLGRVGKATLVGTGLRHVLVWPAVERDPGRLLAGGRLLAALARSSDGGPYR